MSELIMTEEGGIPSTPGTGKWKLYPKSDGWYQLDDAGVETLFSTAKIGEGVLVNGKISVTVSADDLIVAIKTLAGADPSASDPVSIQINGTLRTITAALSVTAADATNWCNAGSSELATKEIDYFVYIGYNATDGVVLGFSRIPYAQQYDDFSATSTNEKYAKISTITTAASTDPYVNIGRFAATLSAGAGYTWTVPTFTPANLIQRPIYETRLLTWQPSYSASVSMTYASVTTSYADYQVLGRQVFYGMQSVGTIGGTPSSIVFATAPFVGRNASNQQVLPAWVIAASAAEVSFAYLGNLTPATFAFRRGDGSNWVAGASKYCNSSGVYWIA